MDLAALSHSSYSFTSIGAAKTACLNDIVNFLTNASYSQSQNTFFNTSGNDIKRSDNCFNNWTVHDSAAGTNQVVLKAAYPAAMGAGKFCYLRIGTNAAVSGESSYTSNFALVFDVFESWNATTHTGVNGAGMGVSWDTGYGFSIYPQSGSAQTLFLGASLYNIFCHIKGHPTDSSKWGFAQYYSGGLSTANGVWSPVFAGILPYAEGGGWHTAASSYPATFCTANQGSGAHPFGNTHFPRLKGTSTDLTNTTAPYAVLDQSCRSTLNSPLGVPTASVPQASGTGNRLLNIVPVHNTIGAVFENPDFNWSEDLAGGVFGTCSNTGVPLDVILDSAGKQYKLFPSGSSTAPYNTGLMFAIRIN